MKKSFIDRIFPHVSQPLLPQHHQVESRARQSSRLLPPPSAILHNAHSTSDVSARSSVRSSGSNTSTTPNTTAKGLQPAPLSASVLHHDDPFLPVERAAKALQDTIQSLLDVQSRALTGRANGIEEDDVLSGGSLTPTQSFVTPALSTGMRTVPIRQPAKKKIGLRGARNGLARKMREFAELREEELQILDSQGSARNHALEHVEDLQTRREACTTQINLIRGEDTTEAVTTLREEAKTVESEIEELEHKLLELRVRHRHLLGQADQLESSLESKISSFQGTISMIDRETRDFLRRPPVLHALIDDVDLEYPNMYLLKSDRRTLEMAKQQWTIEQGILSQRRPVVEGERKALLEGEQVWREAIKRIDHFERNLRTQLVTMGSAREQGAPPSMEMVLDELDNVIESLESDLNQAESNNWNLLICAVGAELEAFQQARSMLAHTQQIATGPPDRGVLDNSGLFGNTQGINEHSASTRSGSAGSNQSLKDTLKEFPESPEISTINTLGSAVRYESEDDEPPADFLVSH